MSKWGHQQHKGYGRIMPQELRDTCGLSLELEGGGWVGLVGDFQKIGKVDKP